MKLKTFLDIAINKRKRFLWLAFHGFYDKMDDYEYLSRLCFAKFGKHLGLNVPKTFNEKMQWLKLNDRKSIYSIMVDKYELKKFVGNKIDYQYIVPSLGGMGTF